MSAAIAYVAFRLWPLALGEGQNDLRAYHFAARTWVQSGNPYDPAAVDAVAADDRPVPFFVYPPTTLPLFWSLQRVSLPVARGIFLASKLLALVLLVLLWRRMFPDAFRSVPLLVLTLVLGYEQALLRDVRAGNVSIFEQLLLWLGLFGLVRGKFLRAGVAVAASAFFKQLTGLFLLLFPLRSSSSSSSRGIGAAALGAILVLGPQVLAAAVDPGLYRQFLSRSDVLWERGTANPSSLVVSWWAAENLGLPLELGTVAYAAVALAAILSMGHLIRRSDIRRDPLLLVCTAAFAYALAVPRMKDYSYILLLMPSLHAAPLAFPSPVARSLFYAALWIHVVPYQPWFTAAAIYTALVLRLPRDGRAGVTQSSTTS